MGIVGMNGFFYHLKLYGPTIVAIKASESPLFLPDSEDDIEDFVESTSLEQLLNFKVSKLKLIFFYHTNLIKIEPYNPVIRPCEERV
jgi:hypothetical protein